MASILLPPKHTFLLQASPLVPKSKCKVLSPSHRKAAKYLALMSMSCCSCLPPSYQAAAEGRDRDQQADKDRHSPARGRALWQNRGGAAPAGGEPCVGRQPLGVTQHPFPSVPCLPWVWWQGGIWL